MKFNETVECSGTKVYGVYFCQDCRAGNTCQYYEHNLVDLYFKKEDAKKRMEDWAKDFSGPLYKDSNSITAYFDTCTCECEAQPETCDYQTYLKAGEWAGLQRVCIEELEVK